MDIPVFSLFQKETPVILIPEQEPPKMTETLAADIEVISQQNPALGAALVDLVAAHNEVMEHKDRLSQLVEMVQDQKDKAEASEAEAQSYQEQTRVLLREEVRAGENNKAKLHALTGKTETAKALAAEYRSFADELDIEREATELAALKGVNLFLSKQGAARKLYSNADLNVILDEVGPRLLKAIKLKAIASKEEVDYLFQNNHLKDDVSSFDVAFDYVKKYIVDNFDKEINMSSESEAYSLIFNNIDVSCLNLKDIKSPLRQEQRRKALEQRRQQIKAA